MSADLTQSSAGRPAVARIDLVPRLAWASGSFATGALFNAMALFALFYMTNILGIAPAVAGTIILLARVYDGIIDPLIGALSDRTRHRWGPRRIYLLIGALGLGITFVAFFNLSLLGIEGAEAGFIVTVILLLYSTAYSIFTIPYLAMPPEIAPGYDDRTLLMSFRVFFQLAGVMAGSVGGPFLIEISGAEEGGYQFMGLTLGIAATALCLVVFIGTARLPRSEGPRKVVGTQLLTLLASPFTDMIKVISNAPFRQLAVIKLCQLAVLSTVLACTPYFFGFVLKLGPAEIGQFYGVFGVSGIISVPFYRWIIAKAGKRESYIALILLYALSLASWILWLPGEGSLFFFLRAFLIGSFSTGTLLCALSMLPDTMEYDRLQSGEAREGIMSGVWTFVENLAGALGPFIIGLLLQANGLVQSGDSSVQQPEAVLTAVHWGSSMIPAIFCLAAVPLLFRYQLDETTLERMRARRV